MNYKKLTLLFPTLLFFFLAGAFTLKFVSAQQEFGNQPPPGEPDMTTCQGGPGCDPCADNPDCHGGPGGPITICSGCQSSYSYYNNYTGETNYYCVDNNQLCGPNQTCSNGTCINNTPTCPGCQVWNGTSCVDNSAYCTNGYACVNGACVAPSPTPTPGNLACNAACTGSGQCNSGYCIGGICRNSSCINDADCTCSTPTPTPTPNIATPTPYRYSCNNVGGPGGGCVTNNDCVAGLSCLNYVCQNAACPGDADCVCPPTNTPTSTLTPTASPTPTTASIPAGFSVVATVLSCNSIRLNWSDGTTALGGAVTTYTPEMSANGGAWNSQTAVNGSTFTSTISGLSAFNSYSFRIRATGSRGSTYTQNVATVNTPACPTSINTPTPTNSLPGNCTVDLNASPQALYNPGQTTLYWSSTGAVGTCVASGGWSGNTLPNDSFLTGVINTTTTFTLTCHDSNNLNCSDSTTFTVGPIACNQSVCTGSAQCGAPANSCVTGICRNSACPNDTDCNCAASPTPTPVPGGVGAVILTAEPPTVPIGGSSILTWTTNSNIIPGTCVASGAWSGNKANSGSQSTGTLSTSSSYTLTCQNSTGTTFSDTVTITVANTPTPTPSGLACNFVCSGNSQCSTSHCYLGVCRNPSCPTDSDCLCGAVATATNTNTPTPTGAVNRTVSGTVWFDTANNNCASGANGYGSAQIQVINDADSSTVGIQTTNGLGAYAPIASSTTPDAHILINNIGSNVVKGVRDTSFGAGFTINYTSGLGYGYDWAANPAKTIDFCIGNALRLPWYQVINGDVRSHLVSNPVPDTRIASPANPSAASIPPGIPFSSLGQTTIPSGKISSTNWQVNREYSEYNNAASTSLGSSSYSFYNNQFQKGGYITSEWFSSTLPGTLPMGPTPTQASGVEPMAVYIYNGNLTINTPLTIAANSKVVFLVNGTVNIQSTITVPTTSLFILAAKGNITVAANVSDAAGENETTAALQGIYSSEGSIIIASAATCDATPDQRLNVWGSLIANSLRPFATNGSGQVVNQRTLCVENRNTPSLVVYLRPAFANQLTEILKTKSRRWSE